jgi:hypothetical protein
MPLDMRSSVFGLSAISLVAPALAAGALTLAACGAAAHASSTRSAASSADSCLAIATVEFASAPGSAEDLLSAAAALAQDGSQPGEAFSVITAPDVPLNACVSTSLNACRRMSNATEGIYAFLQASMPDDVSDDGVSATVTKRVDFRCAPCTELSESDCASVPFVCEFANGACRGLVSGSGQ